MNRFSFQPLLLGIIVLITTPAAIAVPHNPIQINGDSEFTAANGVRNPGAAGTQNDPYIIEGWDINAGGISSCIAIQNTMRFYIVRRNTCVNANTGIALSNSGNSTLENNTVSQIRSGAVGFTAGILVFGGDNVAIVSNTLTDMRGVSPGFMVHGIFAVGIQNSTIARNTISRIFGAAAPSGAPGTPANPDGGSGAGGELVSGIFVAGGLGSATNITVQNNNISLLFGGSGGSGGRGNFSAGNGGAGGPGGSAFGFVTGPFGVSNVTLQSNNISNLHAGTGGAGGAGGFGGGTGGAGAPGGRAMGISLEGGGINYSITGNTIFSLFGASGGNGGFGGAGSNGGMGGAGGDAEGIFIPNIAFSTTTGNTITTLFGGRGGNGGFPGLGGSGGNGGNGGNGIGLHIVSSFNANQSGNNITIFQAGAGGFGGIPGGANGSPGIARDVLIQP